MDFLQGVSEGDKIGPIESLSREKIQYKLTKFIIEVNVAVGFCYRYVIILY